MEKYILKLFQNYHKVAAGYAKHPKANVALKTSSTLPGDDIDEMWRQVYVDTTTTRYKRVAQTFTQHNSISMETGFRDGLIVGVVTAVCAHGSPREK
jgi:hypothetical protein